ncbi:MAG: NAD(P)H-hydrate epimerase, partial [Thermohalobaculum sp.]|nr:NAD(P)H-hydrate epimerase [Thermohalobaculum sp.]
MTELLTAAQMRAIEQAAIAAGEVTGLELMERAGRGVVAAILDWRPDLATAPHRAVVLCGPGNNGGDGFVVARLLRERGWEVDVFLYGDEAKLPLDAAETCRRWREIGAVQAFEAGRIRDAAYSLPPADLVVDALFGTGLARPLASFADVLDLNHRHAAVDRLGLPQTVAIDIPSGLCADSGRPLAGEAGDGLPATAFHAALTVTFHARKPGHVLAAGARHCGRLVCVSIGLERCPSAIRTREAMGGAIVSVVGSPPRARLSRSEQTHKYDHGHALVLSGGVGRGGAARLAARGALRIGAGLVTVGAPPAALIENAAQLNAIMLAPIADAEALDAEITARKIKAVCVGPGPSARSYLSIPSIISAAEIANVDAVHPGYGFLAENAHFAEVCRANNIEFIGPDVETIRQVGDKAQARQAAVQAGIPV